MRILYGTFAQGQGHFSKAAVLVPLLEGRGHEVRVISSGGSEAPPGYRFRWHRHFPGLAYVVSDGRTDYGKSVRKWIQEIPMVVGHLLKLRSLVCQFEPELIISDFEPLTASPLLQPQCEVIAISRQVALFDGNIRLPVEMAWERKMTRAAIRIFTSGADRLYGYHYAPASFRCVPPVIRQDLVEYRPVNGDHLVVYNVYASVGDGSAVKLVEWANRRRIAVRAYGFPEMERGRQGFVEFKAPSRRGILEDMASSRGVITSAGMTTPVEAFLLQKPVAVVPIAGHWEQYVNAFHLDEAGVAKFCRGWDYETLIEMPAPSPMHPLLSWLRTPVEQLADFILDGTPLATCGSSPELSQGSTQRFEPATRPISLSIAG